MCHDVLYNNYVKCVLFNCLIALGCDCINIESSTEGKEEKKRVWTKRKDNEKNQMLCHWCFWFFTNAPMCKARKTGESMDKKGVMVEEWKARRKEWMKKRWKKGKRGKVVLGKVLFVFVWLCLCLFPFFFTCTHHTTTPHHNTRSHSLTTQHDALVHTITCKQGCVLCCLFLGVDKETHTASSTPHTPSVDVTQHTPTNPTQTQLMVQATKRWQWQW